jgi:hypothetical protein
MKASQLIEKLRQFHEEEVYVYIGYNRYRITNSNVVYEENSKSIYIMPDGDDTDNPSLEIYE